MDRFFNRSINCSSRDLNFPIQTKPKIEEGMLTLKMVHISFVALTSIVRRQLFALPAD